MALGDAVSNFFKHLEDIKSSPSMGFDKHGTPVKALTNHYVIGDTTNHTSCYIISHGGQFRTDYFIDNMQFTVPSQTTVLFFHDHGDTFSFSYNKFRTGNPGDLPQIKISSEQKVFTAGQRCENYMLKKFHGRGGANESYEDLQALAAPGNHVFVIVRNRWHSTGVTLESTIKAVQSEFPKIRTFYCMFCRATEDSDTWYSATNRRIKHKQQDGNWV